MNEQWSIEFYREPNGTEPVADFIASLKANPKLQAKVLRVVDLLEEFGTNLSMPHAAPVTGYEFHELRIQFASDIARIFYIAMTGRRLVLLHAFTKKTQKAPKSELDMAQKRLANLRER